METALNSAGEIVFSKDVADRESVYYCRNCKEKVIFVNAEIRCKHFRHLIESECETEPETAAHIYFKNLVFNELSKLNIGEVFLEYPIEEKTYQADVLLKCRYGNKNVAIEVQCTNVSPDKYFNKIRFYLTRGLTVLYLFVPESEGGDFLHKIEPGVIKYSQKEIEKILFKTNKFLSFEETKKACEFGESEVKAAYICKDYIYQPQIQPKFAKGGNAQYNTHRQIIKNPSDNDKESLAKYFWSHFKTYKTDKRVCTHPIKLYRFHAEDKIPRYAIECEDCGKFFKWLSTNEARKLNLDFV